MSCGEIAEPEAAEPEVPVPLVEGALVYGPLGLGGNATVHAPQSLDADAAGGSASAVLRALLVTDLVGSTSLVERLGDARSAEIFSRHDRLARDLLVPFQGLEIDRTDGFLFVFERPVDAVNYALSYQQAVAKLARELGVVLEARAGIHLGEVMQWRNAREDVERGAKPLEVEGLAKPMAARVMSLASGGQVLLTRTAFDLARRALVGDGNPREGLTWLAHGMYRFQGVAEPEEIFEVGVEGIAPLAAPANTEKARRDVPEGEEITLGWRPAAELEVPRREHWRLRERLGEGAFGEVWLAQQVKTGDKRVFKFCYEAKRLHALRHEVTVFRLLKEVLGNRDDIARILDWNFDEAPYFLESEYTAGGSLLDWAAEQGGIGEVPMGQRLELIAQVAEALGAAHSVGVLHKDVKPANVLITTDLRGEPRARLTDFGIGLITDREILVHRGITVMDWAETVPGQDQNSPGGTRLYMAPELLAGGAATVRADIFAVGVMLFQSVAGDLRRPLAPGWRRDIHDPLLAEDIARMVDGSPDLRPATAQEVADNLRSLEQRRAQRRAEEEALRHHLRAARRRRIAAIAAALGGAIVVVVSLLAFQAMEARKEAERRRAQAESLVGFMLGELWDRLEPRASLAVMEGVGDKAIDYLESLPQDALTDLERSRWATVFLKMGEVRFSEGKLPEAMELLRRSQSLNEVLVASQPEHGEWLKELAACRFWIGQVLRKQGDLKSALDEFEAYRDLARKLVELDPENEEWALELAYGAANVGTVYRELGDLDRAVQEHQIALQRKRSLLAKKPDDAERVFTLAVSLNALGALQEDLGSLRAALGRFEEELKLTRGLVVKDPSNTRWIRSLAAAEHDVGRIRHLLGEDAQALEILASSRRRIESLLARDPENRTWKNAQAANLLRIGSIRLASNPVAARRDLALSASILEELVSIDSSNADWQVALARCEAALARANTEDGDRAEALRLLQASVARLEAVISSGAKGLFPRRWLGWSLVQQGQLLAETGEAAQARRTWEMALEALAPALEHSRTAENLDPYVRTLYALGRRQEAEEAYLELEVQGYRGLVLTATGSTAAANDPRGLETNPPPDRL